MSVVAAAVVGTAVVGAVSSSSASKRASSSADASTAASSEATAAQLEFAKEQYADWEKAYGSVQDNLSAYYNSLTPEKYEAQSIQAINQAYTNANTRITQSLAQRGIATSGLAAQAQVDLSTKQAQDTATVRATSDQVVANEKMKFLSLGMGQYANTTAGVSNAYGNQANLATQQSTMYSNQAAQASQGVGTALGSGVNSYLSYNALQNQNLLLQNALGAGGTSALNYNVNTGGALTNAYFSSPLG